MAYCENCGTKLSGGICSNCSEELFIFTEQNEYLPDNISEEFMNKVKEQKENEKEHIKKYFHDKNINNELDL
jgi:hypothetical protein